MFLNVQEKWNLTSWKYACKSGKKLTAQLYGAMGPSNLDYYKVSLGGCFSCFPC